MKKILYVMGIDWAWIYQRPQIIAEKLSGDYDVTIIFPRSIVSRNRTVPKLAGAKMRILWTLPYQEKNPILKKIALYFQRKLFRDIDTFDVVFIGYPIYERYIPDTYKGKIIYDCMDHFKALYPDRKCAYLVEEREASLLSRCDQFLASSGSLLKKMREDYGRDLGVLVRNATKLKAVEEIKGPRIKKDYSLCYIGTIAEWFDFDLLLHNSEVFADTRTDSGREEIASFCYHLIGPAVRQIQNEKLIYHGPVAHEKLPDTIRDYDCLIMPFKMNEIVKYVDPVKLYEYIAFGKCIISVYYSEVEQFEDFVYFYQDAQDYKNLLKRLAMQGFPPKYNEEQRRVFLKNNSWDARYEVIKKTIEQTTE